MNRTLPLFIFMFFFVAVFAQKEKGSWSLKGYVPVYYGSGLNGGGLVDGDFQLQYPRIGIEWAKKRWSHELNFSLTPKVNSSGQNGTSRNRKTGFSWSYECNYRFWLSGSHKWSGKAGLGLLTDMAQSNAIFVNGTDVYGLRSNHINTMLNVLTELKYQITPTWGVHLGTLFPVLFIYSHSVKQTSGPPNTWSGAKGWSFDGYSILIRPGVSYRF